MHMSCLFIFFLCSLALGLVTSMAREKMIPSQPLRLLFLGLLCHSWRKY
jgi:hypothetical protein